ncbi:MAG TPA: type II toxin-antitoxin system HicB family antitoxin [Gemmataceae bacterium]|nr:type II toxin-antitoxin system HicB family antitoxin [Gemmataceae bacterium]
MKLKVIIHAGEQPDQRCRAEVPVLPGCVSEGNTPEEALANIREAIDSYFDATEPTHSSADRIEEIELSVHPDGPLEAPGEELEKRTAPQLPPSVLRRFLIERGRHESAAVVAMTAGLFAALACGALALAPAWLGFLVGYLSTASFAALIYTVNP